MSGYGNGGDHGDDAFVGVMGIFTPWDMSRHPTNGDDLLRKLGKAVKTRAAAIIGVDVNTGRKLWADGVTNERKKNSVGALDPDNWVLRIYGQKGGDGEYCVWSHRLVADHMNHSAQRKMRSTQVVDTAGDQGWAWFSDLVRVTSPSGGSLVSDETLKYDAAGFLPDLYDKLTSFGRSSRGALAIAMHRNLGLVTAGANIGSLAHVFTFPSPAPAPIATPSGQSSGTGGNGAGNGQERPTVFEVIEPAIPPGAPGRPEKGAELMLRWDAKWRHPSGPVRWPGLQNMPGTSPDEGESRRVYLCRDVKGPDEDAGLDVPDDPQSNHARIPKDAGAATLGWYVKVPKPGGCDCQHYDDSYHHPPPENGDGSSGGSSFPPYGGYGDDGADPPDPDADPDDLDGDGDFDDDDVNHPDWDEHWDNVMQGAQSPSARAAALPSRQAQHGFAPPNSPAFSQRFNVHEYAAEAFSVGSMVRTKPVGYDQLQFALELRPSEAIPLGEEIELQVIVLPSYGEDPPQEADMKTASVILTSETPSDTWSRFRFRLKNFEKSPAAMLILFVRRNDLPNPASTVELWRRLSKVVYEVG